ncbi:MAG: amino acid racemase [Tissierellia bacterium]|nr:amino acid racemase [Tissierellia bacterium]
MILGVIGGMGPLATCNFFEKLITLTEADKDQEHIHVVIDNNTKIPDRTAFILGEGEDPRPELIRSALRLEYMGADYIVMPCNTAHFFVDDIARHTRAKIVNMIEEVAIYLKETYPTNRDYPLLATKGTYKAEVYKKTFQKHHLNIIEPTEEDKNLVMEWIYKVKSSIFDIKEEDIESLIDKYVENEHIPVILGCTELSALAYKINLSIKYVDPMLILAKKCVKLHENNK